MKRHLMFGSSIVAYAIIHASVAQGATITHRYTFAGDVHDSVGSVDGVATATGTYTESPVFVADAPTGASGLAQSLRVGVSDSRKSGFSLANSSINLTSGTMGLWIKPAQGANSGDDYVLNLSNPWSNGMGIYIPANTTSLGAVVANNAYSKTSVIAADQWTYVCLSWDFDAGASTGTMKFYVNGALAGTKSFTNLTSTSALNVGGYSLADTSGSVANQFRGQLYDLQIYSDVLSGADVQFLYSNPGQTVAVPEPAGLTLAGMGLLFMARRLSR